MTHKRDIVTSVQSLQQPMLLFLAQWNHFGGNLLWHDISLGSLPSISLEILFAISFLRGLTFVDFMD